MMKKVFAGLVAAFMGIMTVGCHNQETNESIAETEEETVISNSKTETSEIAGIETSTEKQPESTPSITTSSNTESETILDSAQTTTEETLSQNTSTTPINDSQSDEAVEDLDLITPAPATEPPTEDPNASPKFDSNGNEEL